MTNSEKYDKAFMEALSISAEDLKGTGIEYGNIGEWDSIGHMILITALEKEFDIMLDTDDIIDMSSYEKGKEILLKYKIEI